MFADALNARFGEPADVERFAQLAQLLNYETQRAMFEAYTRNRPRATGVIQWMLNNAWPSLIWHLFDWYLRPGGGFFATRKACEPLHAMYSYDDRSVVVTNATRRAISGVEVVARVLDGELAELFAERAVVDVPALGSARAMALPLLEPPPPLRFVDLRTTVPGDGAELRNLYWLPARLDVLDHAAGNWINTPVKEHADLRGLAALPPTALDMTGVHEVRNGDASVTVELINRTERLAFFVELRLADERGRDVLPIHWEDNYVSLLPGDSVAVEATFASSALSRGDLYLHVQGINVPAQGLVFRCGKERTDEGDRDYRVGSEPAADLRV
jgi:exo-1,4-beta-D-glucosaminidase